MSANEFAVGDAVALWSRGEIVACATVERATKTLVTLNNGYRFHHDGSPRDGGLLTITRWDAGCSFRVARAKLAIRVQSLAGRLRWLHTADLAKLQQIADLMSELVGGK